MTLSPTGLNLHQLPSHSFNLHNFPQTRYHDPGATRLNVHIELLLTSYDGVLYRSNQAKPVKQATATE